MPKTSSGKLQRRYTRQLFLENQLMVVTKWEQVSSLEDIEHTLPRDATEKRLLEIWSDLLKIDKIGIHNNFFTLGGQSIKATQVIARIRAEFGVDLPLRGIFENPTVAAIAKLVSTAQEKELFYDIPAILPTRIKSSIPLSFAQQRLWFLDHLINNKAVYNIPVMIKLEGQLNIDALESSFQQIIERHGALRTSFKLVKGEAEQVIDDRVSFCLHKDDLSKIHTKEEKEQKLVSIAHDELTKVFDLNKSPLIRGKIVIFSKTEFVLLITMHHTISDGWSVGVLAEELSSLYNYYAYGSQLELADLPVQYTDYTLWQRSWLKGELLERQLHYWQDKLKNLEALNLPFDKVRPTVFSYAGKTHVKIISKEVTQELKVRIEEQKVTLFMILTAITQVLLYRYSQQEDIIIGTAVSGRRVKELEGLIGFFVNILPIRSNLANNPKFDQFLKETKETVIGAYTNQDVPFEQLIDHLNVSRDLNRHPIFQVLLSLQNTNLDQLKLKNVEVENVAIDLNQAKFDLAFIITEKQNELIVSIEYSSDLFYEDTIARLAEHFEQLLTSVVKDPQQHIDNLSILTNKELQQTLVEWNDNDKNYPQNKTIHQLFEEQVEKTPDNIALVYEDTKLTYRQLNERANQLAHYLVKHYSVKPDSLVALCLDRSKHMLIAILAVLKAGGAYLPMDSTYPDERIKHIMQDSASNIVLTNEAHKERLDKVISQSIVPIDSAIFQEELANLPTQNPGIKSKSSHLAYVIYTSGTTGNPKGVMIEHKGVVNLAITQWHEAEFFSGSEIKSFLGYANYVFDAHVWEFYTAILNGHILHIINNDIRQNDVLLRKYIEDNYINIALLPPVLLDTVNLFTLDLLLVGGDKCSKDIYDYYRSNGVMLVNAYGPSEVTVYASSNYYQNNGASNIGAPIANAKCYVLSPRLTALPIGAIGELYIGGVGLARGYINQSELTAEKFIQNPFQTEEEKQEGHNSRIYKTGDLVRWRADGNLEYVGRNDSQVKIRGYRIELGEIESVLLGYDGIKHSVVLVKEPLATDGATTDNKYLIGYYVSEERLKEDEILTYLQSKLPQYMVPSILVHLEKLPLTINGKLDTKALPEPQFIIDDNKYLAPRNDLEKQLCKIWAEVLIIPEDKVGIRDDFFRLGGNSILAIRLISKLNDALNASVNVSAIFQHSTIEKLAHYLKDGNEEVIKIAKMPAGTPSEQVLSFAQERLWFIQRYQQGTSAYNVPMVFELTRNTNLGILAQSIRAIVQRHEILRTLIKEDEDGNGYQLVLELEEHPFVVKNVKVTNLVGELEKEVNHIFDLSQEYPIRVTTYKFGNSQYLSIVIHHIAFDGWSIDVFLRELQEYYRHYLNNAKLVLPELSIQYKDFAMWQRQYLTGERLDKQLGYWKNKLAGYETLNLITDYPRPKETDYKGAEVCFEVDEDISNKLRMLAKELKVSLYCVLLAGYYLMLKAYSNQTDIVIGTPIANRHYSQTENLIGCFVNTLAMREEINEQSSIKEFIEHVGHNVIEVGRGV
jgi:amino acid adenylation domain-containing protein